MSIAIVGQKNGKVVIRWPQYMCLSLVLSMVMGLGLGAGFFLLAGGRWSHGAALYGIAMGLGIATFGLVGGLRTPVDQLTPVD